MQLTSSLDLHTQLLDVSDGRTRVRIHLGFDGYLLGADLCLVLLRREEADVLAQECA